MDVQCGAARHRRPRRHCSSALERRVQTLDGVPGTPKSGALSRTASRSHQRPRRGGLRPLRRQSGEPSSAQDRAGPQEPALHQNGVGRRIYVHFGSGDPLMRAFSTLRSQFVAVVMAAVILSNLAVVAIVEIGREGELQTARINAAVDRVAAVFSYVVSIPQAQRDAAVAALSGNVIHYSISISP